MHGHPDPHLCNLGTFCTWNIEVKSITQTTAAQNENIRQHIVAVTTQVSLMFVNSVVPRLITDVFIKG